MPTRTAVIFAIMVILGGWYLAFEQPKLQLAEARRELQRINNEVVNDFVARYRMAARNKVSEIELCVHARQVSAACLQAHNEPCFQEWKAQEALDCRSN